MRIPKFLARYGRKDVLETGGIMLKEPLAARTEERLRKLPVKIFDKETNTIKTTFGELSDNHYFVRCPYVSNLWLEAKPVWEDGRQVCYVSKRYHRCLSLKRLAEVADAVSMKAVFDFCDKAGEHLKVEVSGLTGAIDFSLFDNDFSSSFISDCFIVLKSKILELLLDVPKRVYLLTAIISGFVGMFIGALGASFVIGFLLYMAGGK